MFEEKVQNQKLELEKARLENEKLTTRHRKLEEECAGLRNKAECNQEHIDKERKQTVFCLNEIARQRHENFVTSQDLQAANCEIKSLQETLEKLNSPEAQINAVDKELLKFKLNVVECLQDMLVKVRLAAAEKNEEFTDLKKELKSLENDIIIMKQNSNVGSVSSWQSELMSASMRLYKILQGFETAKSDIRTLKGDINRHILSQIGCEIDDDSENFDFKLDKNIKQELKFEREKSENQTNLYQKEIEFLKFQIGTLQNQWDHLSRRIEYNEQIKDNLHSITKSKISSENKTFEAISECKRNIQLLEEQLSKDLYTINESVVKKQATISNLKQRLKYLIFKVETCDNNRVDDDDLTLSNLIASLENLQIRRDELLGWREDFKTNN